MATDATCPGCGADVRITYHPDLDTIGTLSDHGMYVEPADDGSGWFVTCPPNRHHADPERFAVTREDVHA